MSFLVSRLIFPLIRAIASAAAHVSPQPNNENTSVMPPPTQSTIFLLALF